MCKCFVRFSTMLWRGLLYTQFGWTHQWRAWLIWPIPLICKKFWDPPKLESLSPRFDEMEQLCPSQHSWEPWQMLQSNSCDCASDICYTSLLVYNLAFFSSCRFRSHNRTWERGGKKKKEKKKSSFIMWHYSLVREYWELYNNIFCGNLVKC